MTLEEFIEKSKNKHGNRYDYSKVKQEDLTDKVCIICEKHGEFWQKSYNHIHGCGCPNCSGKAKITKEAFIERARCIHGNKYDYSLVEIKGNNKTKVKIKCKTCGSIFEQKINNHLNGQGCQNCAHDNRMQKLRMTQTDFLKKAMEVHSNKYDYSLVEIDGNNKRKIKIKCNKCGYIFEQRIDVHLNGHGCQHCAKNAKFTNTEFVKKAKLIHGNKYDYSLAEINGNSATKVRIKCNKCGYIFDQRINDHISGCGCPKCSLSKMEQRVEWLLEQNNLKYKTQKTFPWLITDKCHKMRLDFYLSDYNVAIECQGEQHYIEEPRWVFTEGELRDIKQRDAIKYTLCKEHGIPIFYIKYDENIENKIAEIINEIKKQQ